MRTVFIQIRLSVSGIALFFIKGSCLLLGMEDRFLTSGITDG